ncbi:MAG: hypothetical protein R3D30_04555 [Hyphomicrobiales bacterium]
MARYTVRKGKRYRATINLGLFQSVASNEMVADKFREVGFTDVVVTGSGRTRHAEARGAKNAAAIPDEISEIHEIEV